jgi:hypothetical protein
MATKRAGAQVEIGTEVLKDLLITELAKANVPQLEIRKIVGCDIHRVNRIARFFRKEKKQ